MKKLIAVLLLASLPGCCRCNCCDKQGTQQTEVGKYSTVLARINRKIDYRPRYNMGRQVEISIKGRASVYNVPGSMDEEWWTNMTEKTTYNVLLEEKRDGKYIWSYEVPR